MAEVVRAASVVCLLFSYCTLTGSSLTFFDGTSVFSSRSFKAFQASGLAPFTFGTSGTFASSNPVSGALFAAALPAR